MKKFISLVCLMMVFSMLLCGCEGDYTNSTTADGEAVEEALDFYEELEEHMPIGATDPENTVDTFAVNKDREETQGVNQEAYYNSEATVTGISGNQVTFSYPGGPQGGMTSVTITDPSHRYSIDREYVITVYDTYVKVVQTNPVKNFGKCDIISAPNDGR